MRLYLIRHAHAGARLPGGRDRYRPLSPAGHERADDLVHLFDGLPIDRLLTSPAVRCRQTVEALSRVRGLAIEEDDQLFEGADTRATLAVLAQLATAGADRVVACSHGDVIPALLEQLADSGVPISGRGCELGSVWVVDHQRGRWAGARYISPRTSLPELD